MQSKLPTLRLRLLLLVVAFGGPMIGFEIWRAAGERQTAIEAAKTSMLQLARTAAALENDSLQEAENLLRVMVRVRPIATAAEGECHALLREIVNEHPRIRDVFVTAADGTIECTALAAIPPKVSLADRQWFKETMLPDAPRIVVSNLIRSRVSGQTTVVVSSRVSSGQPASQPGSANDRVVSVGLDLGWLSDVAAQFPGPAGSGVQVTDSRDGTILARSVNPEEWVGRAFPDSPLLAAFRQRGEGVIEHTAVDGVVRYSGFTKLPGSTDSNMMVSVGIPRDLVLTPLDDRLVQAVGAVLAVMTFGIALAALVANRLLMRPLGLLNGMARELGNGNLSIRVKPDTLEVQEFLLLGTTLNRAATEIETRDRKLAELATRDGLTGLFNRRTFDERIAEEWLRARRTHTPLAVAMIDVDRFKLLNDTYGHATGDERLRQVARTLEGSLRYPCDLSARYGGEEFVVMLTDTGLENAICVADRLVQAIQQLGLVNARSEWGVVTVSIGVAATDGRMGATTPAELIAEADAALYRAKTLGRNRAVASNSTRPPLPGTDLGRQPVATRR